MDEKIEGMIMSQKEWWRRSVERGTSGDMVMDILGDWKREREYLLSKCKELEERIELAEATRDDALASSRMYQKRIKELEEQVLRMIRGDFKQICSYCGWESKMGDWEALENHVREECFSHPLRQANARIRELGEGIKKHKLYMWGDGIVDHPADEELYKLIEKEIP